MTTVPTTSKLEIATSHIDPLVSGSADFRPLQRESLFDDHYPVCPHERPGFRSSHPAKPPSQFSGVFSGASFVAPLSARDQTMGSFCKGIGCGSPSVKSWLKVDTLEERWK